jgi:hypothetical protein
MVGGDLKGCRAFFYQKRIECELLSLSKGTAEAALQ